jgi:hypothetical protein
MPAVVLVASGMMQSYRRIRPEDDPASLAKSAFSDAEALMAEWVSRCIETKPTMDEWESRINNRGRSMAAGGTY